MQYLRTLAPLLFVTPVVLAFGPAAAPRGQTLPAMEQAPRDQGPGQTAPAGTGSISGVVTMADSGQPARRVRVSLSSVELRGGRAITTDESGRFSFEALPAGRFSLSASKPGHVPVSYGQRRPGQGRPGTPIQLADGQKLDVLLQIPRGGVITGTVLDEHGEPIPGTPVRALRFVMQNGHRTLQQIGTGGATDDRGVYRIYGLPPGDYIVTAMTPNVGPAGLDFRMRQVSEMQMRVEAVARADAAQARDLAERMAIAQSQLPAGDEPVSGYAPVYYPGTTLPSTAGTVSVGIAEEKTAIDFQLQLVPVARVEGVVVASNGPLPPSTQVSLINVGQSVPGLGNSSTRADRDGRFRLSNVPPGQYILVARSTVAGGRGGRATSAVPLSAPDARAAVEAARAADTARLWAMTTLGVDGRHVSNLVLTLQPGMTVSGRIAFEGTSPQPPDLTRLRVTASPVDEPGAAREIAASAAGRVDASGRFTIPNVVPGRYRVTATGASQGWMLASSQASGQDTLDFPIQVRPNENVSGLVLTFTDRQAELTGIIVDEQALPAPDYTIVLFPADREFRTPGSRRIFSQRPGTDGRFTFRNMPPGEYRIAPVLDPEPGTWFDPAFLQQLDSTALRVPIGEGEKKVQNLRITAQ